MASFATLAGSTLPRPPTSNSAGPSPPIPVCPPLEDINVHDLHHVEVHEEELLRELPWWKLILVHPGYRARLTYLATEAYQAELFLLRNRPEELTSTQGMLERQVMAQYVYVDATDLFSTRHPNAMIQRSGIAQLRRVALGCMPPAANDAERQRQVWAVEDHLKHKRRASLLSTRHEKKRNAQDILDGITPLPDPLSLDIVASPTPSRNAGVEVASRRFLTEEAEEALYTFPPRPPSPYGWTEMVEQVEARAATRKKVPTYLGAKMDAQGNEIPRRPVDEQGHFLILPEDQQVRLTRSALACIDGTTNLYGLTYFWDMPLPPSGFIRIAPDPRMAMWPDDLREEEKKDASERRKETEERLIRRVNERNRKLMQMRQYGRHIKYEELLMDEDDDDEEADAAARALAEVRRDPRDEADKEKPRPTFDGPLNINVYLSIPRRAPSSSSSLSPAAAASAKPRRLFLGTYRQSRLLLHYKIFCRALHEEHRLRCGAALTHVGGTTPAEMEPPTLNRNHGGYEAALGTSPTLAEETALLANVPRIPFPVLQVQQESPQLRMSMDRRTPSLATVQPARCWEGLCPMPPPDPTSVATHVWKYLHQASLLVQQSLRDIFFSLPRDAEDRLPKKAYVEFVLDLLHLFFPTHLTEMHVAVAEEEWIYRGTSDNVGFDTFFERFFSFPFIFLRDIASVSEQDYVEVWTLIRVCLFEEEATMPMLLPYRRAATATTTTSDGVGSRRGGGIGTRTTTSAMAMAKSPAAPPPLRPRTHSGRDYAAAVADAANHRRDVEGHGTSPFHHAHHASRRETHAHTSSSASTCSDATPRDTPRRLTPITPSSASSTRKRRLSLLSPVDGLTPAQLAHLYCTDFRHVEDYDLHLAEAEVWKKDELVRCARPESQRRLVRQRGQELVAKQRSVEADLRAQQIHEREERQRERHLLEIHSMEQHMEEMCKAAGLRYGTHSSANSSNSTSPTASGASGQHIHHHRAENSHGSYVSRSKQVEIAAAMRRQLIDQMEADRQRAALLSESYRYQERSRRIHAAYVQVLSAVDATSSSWELHHDDVFSPPALTDGIEDRLIRYVKDLDDEVFAGRVSLRERFLVCEGFRRQREKLRREQLESVRRQGRAISPPLVAELERPGSNNNNNNNVVGGPPTEGGKSIGDLYVEAMSADDALAQGPRYTTSGITLAALPVVSSRESPDAAASNLHSDLRTFESYAAGAYPFRPTAVEDPTKIALRVEDVSPDSTWNTFNMTSPLHATIVRRRVKKTSPSLRASGSDRDLSDDDDDDFDDGLGGRRSLGSSRRSFRSPILSPPSEYLSDGCFGHDYIPIGMPPQASAAATGSVVPPVVVLPLALTNPSLYAADKNRLHPSPRRSTEIASGRPPLRPNTARPGTATTAAAAAVANNTLLTPITSAAIASILSVGGMADSAPLQLVSDDLLRSTSARSDYSTHLISPATQGSFSASRSRAPQHASASSSQQPQPRRHHKKPTSPPPPPPISVPASVAAAVQKLHERAEEEDVGEAQRPRRPASGIHAYAREVDEKLGIGDAVVEQTGYNLRPVRQKYGVVPTTKDDDEDDEDAMAAASAAEKMVSMRSPRQMMATPQALAEAAKLSLARTPQDAMAWATTDEDLALRLHTWQDRQRRFQQDRRRAAPKESFISPAPPRSMRTNNNNTSRSTSPGRVVEELPSRRSPTTTTSVRGQAELGAAPYCGYRVFDKARLLDRPQVTYIKRSSRR